MAGVTREWGTPKYNSSNNGAKVGLEIIETLTDTQATYQVKIWFWSRWTCGDTINTGTASGYLAASYSNFNCTTPVDISWSTQNIKLLAQSTLTVARQSTDQATYQDFKLNGIAIAGNQQLTHRVDWTVPATDPAGPPLAPTALSPASGRFDRAVAVAASWQHNPVDGATQSAFEVRWRYTGGSWTTVSGTTGGYTWPAETFTTASTVEWEVRTKGNPAQTWSPWSATAQFTTGSKPAVAVSLPATYTSAVLTIPWSYSDADGDAQTSAELELVSDSAVVLWSGTSSGAGTSVVCPVRLANTATYTVRVRARDASGLWSAWASDSFTTAFLSPAAPTITTLVFSEDAGHVTVTIDNPAGGDAATDTNSVWRSIDGGPWVLLADGIPVDGVFVDWTAATKGINRYRAVAWSADDTTATSTTATITTASCWLYLSGGGGFSTVARLRGEPSVALSTGRPKVLHRFAGRQYPLEFTGEGRGRAYRLAGKVAAHTGDTVRGGLWGTWPAWEQVADLAAPLLYRDPLGRHDFVSIGDDVTITHDGVRFAGVSATLTVVDHTEGASLPYEA